MAKDGYHAGRTAHGGFLFVVNGACPAETAAPSDQRGRKRPHHKSRRGCLSCKRRRVKCDEQIPCSNCLKRSEACAHSAMDTRSGKGSSTRTSQPTSCPVANNTGINLLHLELFHHFERDLVGTLAFSEIWQQVLPWSFQVGQPPFLGVPSLTPLPDMAGRCKGAVAYVVLVPHLAKVVVGTKEPYIMSTILCLAATHLSILRPEDLRYHRVALQLLGRSASLFRAELSSGTADQNIEALVATSILMHYISWSRIEFLDEQKQAPTYQPGGSMIAHLSQDPLFQLSSGVRGVLSTAFSVLWGTDSVFLSASLYSPKTAIEETILQHGDDPHRFVGYFMEIWDDQRYRPQQSGEKSQASERTPIPLPHDLSGTVGKVTRYNFDGAEMNYLCPVLQTVEEGSLENLPSERNGQWDTGIEVAPMSQHTMDSQRTAFERIAKRLSLIFSLVSISTPSWPSLSPSLWHLQRDIERCIFTFPVLSGVVFRDLVLQNDPRVLVLLYYFYRAARLLLTSPASWWASRRSYVIENLILRDLVSRGLEVYILG